MFLSTLERASRHDQRQCFILVSIVSKVGTGTKYFADTATVQDTFNVCVLQGVVDT